MPCVCTHWHTAACIANVTVSSIGLLRENCVTETCSHDYITLIGVVPGTRVWFHATLGSSPANNMISNLAAYSMLSPITLSIKPSAELFHKHLWIEQWFIRTEINRNQLSHGNALRCQVNDIYLILHYYPSELRVPKYMHCSTDKNHRIFQEAESLFSSLNANSNSRDRAGRNFTSSPSKKRVGHRCTKCWKLFPGRYKTFVSEYLK